MSNGDATVGDGQAISIRGVPYAKGLGANASSDITFLLRRHLQEPGDRRRRRRRDRPSRLRQASVHLRHQPRRSLPYGLLNDQPDERGIELDPAVKLTGQTIRIACRRSLSVFQPEAAGHGACMGRR
ncbi:NPCBM/NEW2 domain-containing protein [Kitasatospora sp. NPDC087861]|uniref:NPCBM/NEW2 domain-containing protein n=1 Tax=Kitasatospora sp. NPDC087861 TaxID=3364070 RepID=UPI0037FB4797